MQNKPNSQNAKITTTSYATLVYANIALRPKQKKQTQSNPIYRGKAPSEPKTNPIRNATRDTQYDILNTLHASRFTLHASRNTK